MFPGIVVINPRFIRADWKVRDPWAQGGGDSRTQEHEKGKRRKKERKEKDGRKGKEEKVTNFQALSYRLKRQP